ncbi:Prefoldin, partial [Hanseniaspora valbyensis NRRL Y-1626]
IMEEFQKSQDALGNFIQAREKLETQLQENNIVKTELLQLKNKKESDRKVFKLTGGVLLPVEYDEALSNVNKRLDYINNEIKNCEASIKKEEDNLKEIQKKIQKMRQEQMDLLQKIQQQQAQKQPA